MIRKHPWNGVGGGIGPAPPHRYALTYCATSPIAIAPFVAQVLIPFPATLVGELGWANGGEGGIRTPGTLSGTTDFESVTFGHSATSPKSWARK